MLISLLKGFEKTRRRKAKRGQTVCEKLNSFWKKALLLQLKNVFELTFLVINCNKNSYPPPPLQKKKIKNPHIMTTLPKQLHIGKYTFLFTINLSCIPRQSVRTMIPMRVQCGQFQSYFCSIFVHLDLDSAPLFVGMR